MIRAEVLKNLIYDGNIYKKGEIFDCRETPFFNLESHGIVKSCEENFSEVEDVEEIIPVDGLPSLEDEQKKFKGKKK